MKRVETYIIVVAAVFYLWLLHRMGLHKEVGYIRLAGWGIALTVALEALARIANTLGWRVTIEHYPRRLSMGELFAARIAGEAVDYTTPSAQLGGQFVMALMVRRKLPMAVGLATVIVASLAEALGQVCFIVAALLIGLPHAPRLSRLFWPVLGGLSVSLGLIAGFLFVQLKHPFSHLWRIAARLSIPEITSPEVREAAQEADELLAGFYSLHRPRLLASCLCYFMAWATGPIEIYLLFKFLGQPAPWHVALVVEALGLLVERMTFLIPAKLVSQEGGKALIAAMLGYSPAIGFALGFLRRLKEMIWVLFGLIALMAQRLMVEGGQAVVAWDRGSNGVLPFQSARARREQS